MLTANEIKKMVYGQGEQKIEIDPWDERKLNPNSYNLTLSKNMRWYPGKAALDVRQKPLCSAHVIIPEGGFVLEPHELYLGCTNEYTESHNLIPMINGRSSLARLGISVHQTGGFGDIGFCGNWTLEITCIRPVRIYADMEFAQICWFKPEGLVDMIYQGKYQNSRSDDPVGSKIASEFLSNEFEQHDPRTAADMVGGPSYRGGR